MRLAASRSFYGWALPDGVADGLAGGLATSVGVGTGGSVSVNVGSGDREAVGMADGAPEIGPALTAGALGGADVAEPGRGGRDEYSTVVMGGEVAACAGAAPISPAPPGAPATGDMSAGVPSVQPTVTANGRPRATKPKKMDLGESRTP